MFRLFCGFHLLLSLQANDSFLKKKETKNVFSPLINNYIIIVIICDTFVVSFWSSSALRKQLVHPTTHTFSIPGSHKIEKRETEAIKRLRIQAF